MSWPRGRSPSEEQRQKISTALRRAYADGRRKPTRYRMSEEARKKMSATQKRIGDAPAERVARSIRAREGGYGLWMVGRKLPREVVAKIVAHKKGKSYSEIYGPERARAERLKRKAGNLARWAGIQTGAQIRPRHNSDHKYAAWRKAVFKRDGYACQVCRITGGRLEAHHVQSWARYPSLRHDVLNGETLCSACHRVKNAAQRGIESRDPVILGGVNG